jgi:hypothetical protein
VSFKLPDNLTTWVVAVVAVTPDTDTGQNTAEMLVTKDLIARPFLPNLTRDGDKVVFTGQVHNFTDKSQDVAVTVDYPVAKFEQEKQVQAVIEPGGYATYQLPVVVEKTDPGAKFTLYATASSGLADRVIWDLPAKKFGFMQKKGEAFFKPGAMNLAVPEDTDKLLSQVQVYLAANSLGAVPEAMAYLLEYPYGCVEQTTSRLMPAIIAKIKPSLMGEFVKDIDVDKNIRRGLELLADQQTREGGWGWWDEPGGSPFITAYVVRYLTELTTAGVAVDEQMQARVVQYLINLKEDKPETTIPKYYALGLLAHPDGQKPLEINDSTPSDLLALAVLHNSRLGIKDAQRSGLQLLLSKAKDSGGRTYWEGADYSRFGSVDASTGLALQALVAAGGDRDLALKVAGQLQAGKQKQYWSNSFATVQVIQGILDLYEKGGEKNPNYGYTVKFNGQVIKTGRVTEALKLIPTVNLDATKLGDLNRIEVSQEGEGQLYFTIVSKLWRTSKEVGGEDSGIKLVRTYESEKGPEYSIGVGDVVNIHLQVKGMEGEDLRHLVIEDKLPAGLVPVNNKLKNERGSNEYYYYWTNRRFTDEGVVMAQTWWDRQEGYTYQARAVIAGDYWAPPATAELMYQPTINAITSSDRIQITETATYTPMKSVGGIPRQLVEQIRRNPLVSWPVFITVTAGLIGIGWWWKKKRMGQGEYGKSVAGGSDGRTGDGWGGME